MSPLVKKEATEWVLQQQADGELLVMNFDMVEKALEIAEREKIFQFQGFRRLDYANEEQ